MSGLASASGANSGTTLPSGSGGANVISFPAFSSKASQSLSAGTPEIATDKRRANMDDMARE